MQLGINRTDWKEYSSSCSDIQKTLDLYTRHYNSDVTVNVVDTHNYLMNYDDETGIITYDRHCSDLALFLAIPFASKKTRSYHHFYAGDLIIVDSAICANNWKVAYNRANHFRRLNQRLTYDITAFNKAHPHFIHRVTDFFYLHEFAHSLQHANDDRLKPYIEYLKTDDSFIREKQKNAYINSIDLTPIMSELDAIDGAFLDSPVTDLAKLIEQSTEYSSNISRIINSNLKELQETNKGDLDKDTLFLACDNYIKGVKLAEVDQIDYEKEYVADSFALNKMLHTIYDENETIDTRLFETMQTFFVALLTINIVATCRKLMSKSVNYLRSTEDMVYNRLRMEQQIIIEMFSQYAKRRQFNPFAEYQYMDCYDYLFDKYSSLYTLILELIISEVNSECDELPGDNERNTYYDSIRTMMS